MELKDYQSNVIKNLNSYMKKLEDKKDVFTAWQSYWLEQDIKIGDGIPNYKNEIEGVPKVCMKVPTGGGKTFMACVSLKTIFNNMPYLKNKVVVWLVPSEPILFQTVKNLSNVNHPYRQNLNINFNNRVEVYTKEMLLNGQNFSPDTLQDILAICVMSFDSFRIQKKDGRNVYKENGNLKQFADFYKNENYTNLENISETALIQTLRHLNPVVVVDESHNASSDLSIEMLRNLNPSFILELTATPKDNSNVISYVDARELKKENMVKLPVVVYNRNTYKDVIRDALSMRKKLEYEAKIQETNGGEYIRPIILFQAQPKTDDDSETFDKIKKILLNMNISEEEIAIKTANINELKEDLLSKNCKIRYIITVNALKEGWDCPFAYILASLANRSSNTEVEQILGRILRQPYVKKYANQLLNTSYVFTSSDKFYKTIDNIIEGLKLSGFSNKEYRLAQPEIIKQTSGETSNQLYLTPDNETSEKSINDLVTELDKLSIDEIKDITKETNENENIVQQMVNQAEIQTKEYDIQTFLSENSFYKTGGINDMRTQSIIQEEFREEIENLKIPQFFKKGQIDLFGSEYSLLEPENLSEGFKLNEYDAKIPFNLSTGEIYTVDIDNDKSYSTPKYLTMSKEQMDYLRKTLENKPKEQRVQYCSKLLVGIINKNNRFETTDVIKYVNRVIENLSNDELSAIELSLSQYAETIKDKIEKIEDIYREKIFDKWIDNGKIICQNSYKIEPIITPIDFIDSIPKSLYNAECNNMNGLERDILDAIIPLDNIKWWHRIIDRKGFRINGFINHYPDFMVRTKSNKLILIETKGDDRDNSDSKQKIKLGRQWQAQAGNDYRYFMVFNKQELREEGAYIKSDFIEMIKDL